MHNWICAIIESLKLLPSSVANHFRVGSYFIGGAHFETNDEGRQRLWQRLGAQLKGEIDAVLADPALKRAEAPDLSDRPTTKGERLVKICDELQQALTSGRDADQIAARLEREASGTPVAFDARQIRKLLAKRRISDLAQHQADLYRLVGHARLVAGGLNHLE
ncbi:hypothetical protein [Bosea sp. (in: a-proteobacteria)]|uniref:hypothetical protein n=1 Tax=Bosea sp. (in: a-proteobacteria) TaxID=1871050 RepID=UPI001AD05FD8|nr:hypothetical protein [Bosea sp. (in: a-proteobacteria)]MBN9438941.1 hypothetical protein [Bosea sp. (in: a-proteobacteria)]